jgi:glutamine synthetase
MLPRTLDAAIEAFAADPLSRTVFGDAMFKAYVAYKKEEWESYHCTVSEWEYNRYLTFF